MLQIFLLVCKNIYVFTRGGDIFEFGGFLKKSRGKDNLVFLLTRIYIYLPEEVVILKYSVKKKNLMRGIINLI